MRPEKATSRSCGGGGGGGGSGDNHGKTVGWFRFRVGGKKRESILINNQVEGKEEKKLDVKLRNDNVTWMESAKVVCVLEAHVPPCA